MINLQQFIYQAIFATIASMVLLTPCSSFAVTIEEVTNPRATNGGWVTDMADLLSDRTETELNQLINELERTDGTEIAVVTVTETLPAASPKAFATELFNYWGIGKAQVDNGVLMLISATDKRVEIETGYGIAAILPNVEVQEIIDSQITPQYKLGNFNDGTLDGIKAIINVLNPTVVPDRSMTNDLWIYLGMTGTGLALIGTGIYLFIKNQGKIFLNPNQKNQTLERSDNRVICCAECRQPMTRVTDLKLNQPQKIAQKLGSVHYRGYRCSQCSPLQTYSLIAYVTSSSRYQVCSQCLAFTVTRCEEITVQPTSTSKGKKIILDRCHNCNYSQRKTLSIPRLHSRSSSSYYGSGCNGYSGGGDSGGSGGSGFGGGSSGGDGAGGSW